jgi:hypothetical protein
VDKKERNNPYVSFVVTSRNDDHGGDMKKRMHVFYNGLRHQCNKYKLPCELVMVDWNSPDPDKPLSALFEPLTDDDYLFARFIVVPHEEHAKLRYHEQLPLFQMIAKNVGIRRAKAPFVLCTNVDLLFCDELIQFLAQRKLEEGKFYRANRCDVSQQVYEFDEVEEQLKYCRYNIRKRLGKHYLYSVFSDQNGLLMRSKIWKPLVDWLARIKAKRISKEKFIEECLDFDACGDFTLMSKKDWERIDGYVELEMYSLHIDSMALYSCVAQGIEQVILPPEECCYHIEHAGGWEIDDPIEKLRFYEKKPSLEWWAVEEAGEKIINEGSNFNINDENWGLNNLNLMEEYG